MYSIVSFFLDDSHNFCNFFERCLFAAQYQAVGFQLPVPNNYLLFISSLVRFYLAESHNFFNDSKWPLYAAQYQTAPPSLSVPNKLLFISSIVTLFLANSHNFLIVSNWPSLLPSARRSFPHCLCQITIHYLCPRLLNYFQPTPIVF